MKYIFCIIALLLQPLFTIYMCKSRNKAEAALRLPLAFISGLYLVIQIYVFIKYCSKFPEALEKWSYLIQLAILIVFIVIEFALLGSNKYINNVQENEQASIYDFKSLIQELQICLTGISDAQNRQCAEALLERMRYEDPVSSYNVYNENSSIHILISELNNISDNATFAAICQQINQQLDIRKTKNTKEQG